MSCAEWPRLRSWVAGRLERGAAEGSPADTAAPRHLAECAECRRRAYALDPSLLFLKLRSGESGGGAGLAEINEINAMRERVAALRRTGGAGRGSRAGGWRWAAAALLVGAGLAQGARPPALGPAPVDVAAAAAATAPELDLQPLVEELGRPEARVYQFAGDDLSVVMIVDESLDI